MAVAEQVIKVLKHSPLSEEAARSKAEFDAHMHIVRFKVKYATREDAVYFHRELMGQLRDLERRFGLGGPAKLLQQGAK